MTKQEYESLLIEYSDLMEKITKLLEYMRLNYGRIEEKRLKLLQAQCDIMKSYISILELRIMDAQEMGVK